MDGLVERDDLLAQLTALVETAESGIGHLVFIGGEAGAGKSSLVQALGDSVSGRARMLTGWCDPLSAPRPAGPLVDMARELGDPVAAILRQDTRPGLFDATLTALAGSDRPSVLIFEDIHWADETTLDLLRFLGRRIATVSAVVIATYRDDEVFSSHPVRAVLGDLSAHPQVSRLAVPPLSAAAVSELAGADRDGASIWAHTGGNPFFVIELLQAPPDSVPATVADAVVARTSRLSPDARHALRMAAVLGARSELATLLELARVNQTGIEECVQAGLLTLAPRGPTFRHELVRQAVLSITPPAERRTMHQQVLAVLRNGPPDEDMLARLAEHAENANDVAAVLEFAPAAGRRAAGLGSHREAIRQYERALRVAAEPATRADLLERLSYEQYLTADLPSAIGSRREAIELRRSLGDTLRVGVGLRWQSRHFWYSGDRDRSETYANEALATLDPLGPSAELAMAMSSKSQLLMLGAHHEQAIRWGERAIEMAQELDVAEVISHANNNIGSALLAMGDLAGRDRLQISLAGALAIGSEDHAARAYVNLAVALVDLRLLDGVRTAVEDGLAFTIAHDLDLQTPYLRAARASLNLHLGQWPEAEREARDVVTMPGITLLHEFVATVPLTTVELRRGEAADERLDALGRLARDLNEAQRLGPYAVARAEAAWLRGLTPEVEAELVELHQRIASGGAFREATELTAWLRRLGVSVPPPDPQVGPFADAWSDWRAAADRFEALGAEYDAAVCLMSGPEPDVRRALAIFSRLGARPAATRAQSRLRELGAISIPRGPRATTKKDPNGLTARQHEVLELVAAGLSDNDIAQRLFLSPRTVGHHVSAILAKLGASSREEASRKAGR